MREKPEYRDILETILTANAGKILLTQEKAAEILGLDPRTVKHRYGVGRSGVAAATLARKMCE